MPLLTAHIRKIYSPRGVSLLPKLREQFAEFLDQGSLDRLRILFLTTSVGLGTSGARPHIEVFLGSIGSPSSSLKGSIVAPQL